MGTVFCRHAVPKEPSPPRPCLHELMLRPVRHERYGCKGCLSEPANNQAACGLVVEKRLHGMACRGDGRQTIRQAEWGRFSAGTQCRRNRHHPRPCLHELMLGPVRHERCGCKGCLSEKTNDQAACGLVVEKGLHGMACRGDGSNGEKQNGDGFLQAHSAEGTVTNPGRVCTS